ncbi:unnamed protein product [Cuscuta campestris]|uniref:Pentacotripeptide-repeat region of PRORP domain-containing protein n=1 Tax=Cuscuta campestris TaxID=132261 RepID=A0A484L156_9ASTE|nr:unnamed protein product [Cuscuta campestris]
MAAYTGHSVFTEALQLFRKLLLLSPFLKPDGYTYPSVLKACGGLGCHDAVYGRSVHGRVIRTGFLSDVVVASSVVGMYAKGGNFGSATDEASSFGQGEKIYEELANDGFAFDGLVASALVDMYGKCGHMEKAEDRMNGEDMKPSLTTLSSLLSACFRSAQLCHRKFVHAYIIRHRIETGTFLQCILIDLYLKCGSVEAAKQVFITTPKGDENTMSLAALDIGREVHKSIVAQKLDSSEIVMGALLDMHAKCGALNEALEVFHHLPWRDIVLWTSMLVAYGSHGQAVEALRLFNEMLQQCNVKPDKVTFLAMVSACSHAGLVAEVATILT